ncbi:MAG: aldose 1-epimerase [Candidatus Nanopelagicales bacterium]|nr:aldose 1-epimerase [Candidatus Nanopelagicales bacterium]
MYEITRGPHPDLPEYEALTLVSPANVRATFVPRAGMVCSSMTHDGDEMLGQRYGLQGYLETGRTFGVPILAPWANRLGRMAYAVVHEGGGIRRIDVNPNTPHLRFDAHGQPIHGLLRGSPDWEVVALETSATEASITAQLTFDQRRIDFSAFPFEHRIDFKASLRSTSLTFSTEIHAIGQDEVPIAFGWHPYLRIPGLPRREWEVYFPFTRRCPLGPTLLPEGTREDVEPIVGKLGERRLDDLFADVENGTTAFIRGNGRKMSIRFDTGYDWAILYGPPHRDHICVEPMTAASDPFSGQDPMEVVPRGRSFRAAFTISVDRTS